ncbi:pentatricopeptide repeat-containing protein [Tanacetum coccineum]
MISIRTRASRKTQIGNNWGILENGTIGKLETAMSVFSDMEKAGFLPTPSTYSCLLEMHASSGRVDDAMKLYNSMSNAGVMGYAVDVTASDVLMAFIKEASVDHAFVG